MAASNADSRRYTPEELTDLYHTGPGTLAGRLLRRFWHPIHRAEDLRTGRARPVRFASEDFTLYRGESGTPHIVAFRCAHRGTQLSTGWVEGEDIRCFYHGWKYGPDGQCIEQPAEPEPFCGRIRIKSYPTEEYLGLIFGYFGDEEPPPPLPRFPELEDEDDGVREAYTYGTPWNVNVFNSLENDPFHGAWVHRESYIASGRVGTPTVTCEETEYGYTTHIRLPEGATHWPEAQNHFVMPNASYATRTAPELGRDAWREAIAWRVPVDDTHMTSFGVNFTHLPKAKRADYLAKTRAREAATAQLPPYTEVAEAVLRGELRIEDIPDRHQHPGRLFNIQDYVSQVGQGAIPDTSQWHFGREDVTVIMLRTLWQREMRNLAEGRPLKQWRHTGRLSVGKAHV